MSNRNWIDTLIAYLSNKEPETERLTIEQAVRDRTSALMRIKELDKEIARLKRGDFTKEEFQNLCHNRHDTEGCTAKEFYNGCAAYQKQLFGKSERDLFLSLPATVEMVEKDIITIQGETIGKLRDIIQSCLALSMSMSMPYLPRDVRAEIESRLEQVLKETDPETETPTPRNGMGEPAPASSAQREELNQ